MIKNLKSKIKDIPLSPGVYFFSNKNRRPLYVGKAANLRNRIKQYFDGTAYGPFLKHILTKASALDFRVTGSEIEAFILESQLIKRLKPQYNIKLRDDKQYFFVGITHEKFPKIFLTHQPNKFKIKKLKFKISQYIGPFTDGVALKSTLRLLRKIFPYCTCKQKHNNFCLNYHIGKCLGYCCLKIKNQNAKTKITMQNSKIYKRNIKAVKSMLSGRKESLIKKLERELNKLGKKEKLEEAIALRNKIEKLKRVFKNAQILRYFDNSKHFDDSKYRDNALEELKKILKLPKLPKRIEGYDISNIQGTNATGAMVVFTEGVPDKNEYRKFKIRRILSSEASREGGYGDIQMLKELLLRRLNHPEWPYPDLILIDGGKGQLNAAHSVISNFKFLIFNQIQNSNFQIPIIALTKDKKHKGDHIFTTNPSYASPSQNASDKRGKASEGKKKLPIKLSSLPVSVKNLILHIDSEAHRFAISYYRKLHRKVIV